MADFYVPPLPLLLKHQQRAEFVGGDVIETDVEAELQGALEIERPPQQMTGLALSAGLTQTQLAKLVDTTASVICRLEDADYEGHSLAMLRRIAGALKQRVETRFVPIRRSA